MLIITEESSCNDDSINLLTKSVSFTHSLYEEEAYHSYEHDKISKFFIARWCDEAVGCGAYTWVGEFVVEVKHVFVLDSQRGMGTGKKIMNYIEKQIIKAGAEQIILETTMKQQAAINMYLAMGYEYCEPYQHKHHDEQVFMTKRVITSTPHNRLDQIADR